MSTLNGSETSGFKPQTPPEQKNSDSEPSPSSSATRKSSSPLTEAQKAAAVGDLLSGKVPDKPPETSQETPATTQSGNDAEQSSGSHRPDDDPARVGAEGSSSSPDADIESAGGITIKELATQLGTSPKKLYESLEIGLADGETITLSEMKNQFKRQDAVTREYAERDQQLSQREAQMLENLQLLQSVQSDLAGKLSPEVVQQLQTRTRKQEVAEQQLLFQAAPELRDSAKLDSFRSDVAEAMGTFGFKPHELVIRDHRIALAMRDYVRVKRQLNDLLALNPDQQPPKSHKPQRGNSKTAAKHKRAATQNRARGGTQADKVAAVNQILKG